MTAGWRPLVAALLLAFQAACVGSHGDVAGDAAETEVAALINLAREDAGLAPLTYDSALETAAARHAADLVLSNRLSHSGSDGSSVGDRIAREGLVWCRVAENVAQGQQSAGQVVSDWLVSPGHRRNILGGFSRIGTARDGDTWVAVFMERC